MADQPTTTDRPALSEAFGLLGLGLLCWLLSVWALQVGISLALTHNGLGGIDYPTAAALRLGLWLVKRGDEDPTEGKGSAELAGRTVAYVVTDWLVVAVLAALLWVAS